MSALPSDIIAAKSAYALIVGIGQYQDEHFPRLNFTHADAQSFSDLLLNPNRAGFSKENVKLLLDEQATLSNIKKAISGWLFKYIAPDSTVLVFFAGHGGVESDKTNTEPDGLAKYLLPWDADHDNLFASALSNAEFNRLLSTVKARRLVVFLDACYAGGVMQQGARGARDVAVAGITKSYEQLAQGEGRIVIAAAKPNQQSWEDPSINHGIFTYHLLEALKGEADTDNDGSVSIMEVFHYLEREVPKSVRRLANSVQEPFLCGSIAKDIVLTVDAERIAEDAQRRKEEAQRREKEIKEKRRKLFDLYDRGDLPLNVYNEALNLISKPTTEMAEKESELAESIEALLKGGIPPTLYLKYRAAILGGPPKPSESKGDSIQPPTPPPEKYCIHCGVQINPQNKFCVSCGRPIKI